MVEPPPGEVAIRASRVKYGALLLVAIGFVAMGAFLVAVAHEPVMGWVSILLFSGCALVFARQLLDSRPRLVIDDRGILDRTLGVGVIPWGEITEVRLQTISGNDFLCLEVRDPAMFVAQFGAVRRALVSGNRALGFAALNVNLSGLPMRGEAILALVRDRVAARRDCP